MMIRRSILIVSLAAVALAACGGGGDSEDPAAAPVTEAVASDVTLPGDDMSAMTVAPAPAAGASFNDADVAFSQGMIPHHEGAIEMSDIALDPAIGAGAAIKELAAKIKAAQDPEIDQMKALLTAWGQPMAMDMSADEMANMDGMMSMDDMMALEALKGAEFDKAWAAMMIEHHNGAIAMAQTVKAAGSNPEILALADAIIAGQSAEIEILTPMAG